jgi:hypothetical protein
VPTLGAILKTISGLYIPTDGHVGFREHELLEALPGTALREPFQFRKIEQGIYVLVPRDPSHPSYELRSRRIRRREETSAPALLTR